MKAGTEATPRSILMKLGTVDLPGEHLVEDEAYTLNVDSEAESVTMMANKPAGISHATHTMLNILNPSSRTLPVVSCVLCCSSLVPENQQCVNTSSLLGILVPCSLLSCFK